MKREELEKYMGELSPELQEKARQCKNMTELNALLAENEVELSEDALEAVSGGCTVSSSVYNRGDMIGWLFCPACYFGGNRNNLRYWDECYMEKGHEYIIRMYCDNPKCSSYNNGLWWVPAWAAESKRETWYPNPEKY